MSEQNAKSVVEASIAAVVIRKDGTREDLGTVSYYHRNPVKRALWAVKQKLKQPRSVETRERS